VDRTTADVVLFVCSVAGGIAGIAWLGALRAGASSWSLALGRHQIQAFNASLLVGLGILVGLAAVTDINPALLPRSAVLSVGLALGLVVEGSVMVVAHRRPPR
jgi:hypothetical protein